MKLITALSALSLVSAQALFEGDTCNLNIPRFDGPNAAIPVTWGKADYIDGQMVMTLTPPADPSDPKAHGNSVIGTTTLSLLYGTVEATIQQSTIGGVVTYLTLINQESKDEIDFEWIGNERTQVWTNFFYRGRRERDPITLNEIWSRHIDMSSDNSVNAHDYKIDWTPESMTWSIDGTVVHVQHKNGTYELANTGDMLPYDHFHYPDTPLTVNVGIWNSQDPVWSNGPVDWTQHPNGVTAKVSNLKVTCYQGEIPTNTLPIVVPTATATVFQTAPVTVPPPASSTPVSSVTPAATTDAAVTSAAEPSVTAAATTDAAVTSASAAVTSGVPAVTTAAVTSGVPVVTTVAPSPSDILTGSMAVTNVVGGLVGALVCLLL
ncbi:hypothetical protein HDU98_000948 [Podochytrium sp. JEL0797]|nr:hypothetical protein HDU98_000948 [Podochytrium sp. JEL0797]